MFPMWRRGKKYIHYVQTSARGGLEHIDIKKFGSGTSNANATTH